MTPSQGPPDETLDELYTHAPVGYASISPDGIVTRANATLAGWLGVTDGGLEGRRLQEFLTPGARIFYETHCAPILRVDGILRQVALDLRCSDGTRLPTLVDWRRVDSQQGELLGFRLLVVDATDRRSYERELLAERRRATEAATALARLNAELESIIESRTSELVQLKKIESLGQLTGGVAHDFNNLLTPIIGCLDLLGRRVSLDPRSARLLQGAAEAAERARVLVSRLLTFARKQHLDARAVDLGDLVKGTMGLIARSVGPLIDIHLEDDPVLPPAWVDASQLELALLNLCVNARDAMNGSGRLNLRLTSAPVGAGHPSRLVPGFYLAIAVRDEGCGMDAATLLRATEPFFTTKPAGQGTGLGLSMAQGLAQQSGGALLIESAPGRGTTVTILLPRAPPDLLINEVVDRAPSNMAALRPLRILLVDDDILVRDGVSHMLRDLGHHVLEAATGDAALALLAGVQGPPDLLITDFAMPGMTGVALAQAACAMFPALPVLLITGYSDWTVVAESRLRRLAKPFRLQELVEAIAEIMEHSTHHAGSAAAG